MVVSNSSIATCCIGVFTTVIILNKEMGHKKIKLLLNNVFISQLWI